MKKYYNIFLLSALTVLLAVSCQDDNFDWDKAHSTGKEIETAYAEHFKQIFGEVSPTQSWDFTQQENSETRAGLASPERFGGYSGSNRQSVDNWYSVPTALTTWLDTNLKEQVNNKSKGKPLAFSVPSNGEFDLIPVYQGMAYSYWHMNMGIQPMNGGEAKDPIKFWEKNQDIEIYSKNVDFHDYGGVFYLQSKKNNKYLKAVSHDKYIVVKSGAKVSQTWDNQFFLKANKDFTSLQDFTFEADIRADKSANISTQIHENPGNYRGGGNVGDISFTEEWSHIKISSAGLNFKTIGVSGNTIAFQLNDFEGANNYYFKNVSLKIGTIGTNMQERIVNGDLSGSDMSSFIQKVNYGDKSGQTVPCTISTNSFVFVDKDWQNPQNNITDANPYTSSKEHGVRFTVVSVKKGKYLFSFYDNPANGRFVTVNSNGELALVDKAEDALEARCYFTENYYDHYLMLGDYLVYCDDAGNIKANRFDNRFVSGEKAHYPWEASNWESELQDDRYKWNFETLNRHRYEYYKIYGGDSNVQDISSLYDGNSYDWKPVRADLEEKSMQDDRSGYKQTRSKGYHFSGLTPGDVVYFYWESMAPYWRRNSEKGRILSSLNDQMRIINYGSTLEGIPSGKVVSIIGCEAGIIADMDANDPKEPDYNDMVFLLITDEEPKVVDVKDIEETIEKRYMVEDLGASDDIDFNDMVVDLKQVKKYEITTMSDGKSKKEYKSTTQTATLRAMGGTLDFDFNVGYNTVFTKSKLPGINYKNMYKTGLSGGKSSLLNDYTSSLYTCTVPNNAWDPSTNNVSFTVYKEGTSTASDGVYIDNNGAYTITFPNVGDEAPHIIAFPVTKLWRDERHECCSEWLYDREPALWEMPENDPDENKNTHTENFKDWIKSNRENYLQWIKTNFSDKVKEQIESWLNSKYPSSN